MNVKQARKEMGGRLYQYRLTEWLTSTSPFLIIPLDLLLVIFFLYIGYVYTSLDYSTYWWIFFTGLFTWTLMEYLLHRFAFHFPARKEKGKRTIYMLHGIHHDHPNDPDALYQPPLVNLLMALVLFGILYLLMGIFTFLYMPGIILGYLLYSTIHYSIHKFKPPFRWMMPLWRHHNLHHYRFPNKGYGVSSPLWDFIFGTLPPKDITRK